MSSKNPTPTKLGASRRSRGEQRAAKELQRATGLSYTRCLRMVREMIDVPLPVTDQQRAIDAAVANLREVTDSGGVYDA